MKSSSELFPVALASAEFKEGVYEDVYSLKPNNSTDKTVEIALVRLHQEKVTKALPLLLVHDAFYNHWQWLDYGVGGTAGELVRQGYDVWLLDWRGHGLSSRNQRPQTNTLDIMAEYDLPSVFAFIEERCGHKPAVVARGMGCELISRTLAYGETLPELLFVNSHQLPPRRLYWLPGAKLIQRIRLLKSAWVKGPGEEMEVRQLFRQLLKKGGWFGGWKTTGGQAIRPSLDAHQDVTRWVFEPGRTPSWLKRMRVAEDHRSEARVVDFDWAALLPKASEPA
ncbi:alpha/beta fold hydrolase [Saccharospirillum sp. HFRX-1]|uniref:alpha/beta hydrolase n=1 Tax=unclassified Saccharospirillum TaxID=2633430 RepID=UPI003717AFC7